MGKFFQEIAEKLYVHTEGSNQKGIHEYRVGELVKNVMVMSVHTLWIIPKPWIHWYNLKAQSLKSFGRL